MCSLLFHHTQLLNARKELARKIVVLLNRDTIYRQYRLDNAINGHLIFDCDSYWQGAEVIWSLPSY